MLTVGYNHLQCNAPKSKQWVALTTLMLVAEIAFLFIDHQLQTLQHPPHYQLQGGSRRGWEHESLLLQDPVTKLHQSDGSISSVHLLEKSIVGV